MAILWGTSTASHANPSWNPFDEETVDSTHNPPHTFGFKWGLVRVYNDNGYGPAFPILDSGATHHANGTIMVLSVGHQYYAQSCVSLANGGTTGNPINKASEAQWDAFFDGLLGFGANALSYAAGAAQIVYFIVQHEFDNSKNSPKWGTAAEYVAYYQRVYARYQAALTRHSITPGSAQDRVKFGWCPTQYGMTGYAKNGSAKATPYWPEDASHQNMVYFVGSDAYNDSGWGISGGGAFSAGAWKSFATMYADTEAFASDKNKKILHGEFDTVEWNWDPVAYPNPHNSPNWDPTKSAQFFTDAASHMLSNGRYLGACIFSSNGTGQAALNYKYEWAAGFDGATDTFRTTTSAAGIGKHEALRQAILSTQGTPAQGLPSKAVINSGPTSSADGTQVTIGWANPPGGDNVTGWRAWIAPASGSFSTYTLLSAASRSVTFQNLTPGTQYKIQIEAVNSAGPSGYNNTASLITTSTPSVNGAPAITSFTAVTSADGHPGDVDVTVVWSDPNNDACTIVITDSVGNSFTIGPTTTSPATQTISYSATGTFTINVVVTDPGGLSASSQTSVAVDLGGSGSPNYNWPLTLPGTRLSELTSRLQQFELSVDQTVYGIDTRPPLVQHNQIYGLVASTFDPASTNAGAIQTMTPGSMTTHLVQVQGDGAVNFICFLIDTLAVGSGSSMSIWTADGITDLADATTPDNYITAAGGGTAAYTKVPCQANLNPGDLVLVKFYIPSSFTSGLKIRATSASSPMYNIGLSGGSYRSAQLTGLSSDPSSPLPLSSMSASNPGWVGLSH